MNRTRSRSEAAFDLSIRVEDNRSFFRMDRIHRLRESHASIGLFDLGVYGVSSAPSTQNLAQFLIQGDGFHRTIRRLSRQFSADRLRRFSYTPPIKQLPILQ